MLLLRNLKQYTEYKCFFHDNCFFIKCQGILPTVWGSPQSELIPHRSRRKTPLMRGWCSIQTACTLTMKRGISDKQIIAMWQLFLKLAVSSVVVCVIWGILSHLTIQDKTGMCSTTKIDVLLSLTMLWKMKFRVGVLRFKPQGTLNWCCSSWCSGGLEKKTILKQSVVS